MRVLQIINSLGTGGAEKLLLETIPQYVAAGVTMDLLVLWDNKHPFLQQLEALQCCKVIVLKSSSQVKDVYKLSNIPAIRKLIKAYDLIHVHLFPAQYFAAIANIGIGKKMIFTEHNTTNRRIQKKWLRPVEKQIYKQYSKLIAITEEIQHIYQDYLQMKPSFITTIPNGINLNTFSNAIAVDKLQLDERISQDDYLVMQVAAFRPQKDHATLIKAMQHLPGNFKLLLVGDGATKPAMQMLVSTLNLQERVLFLGQRMDVPALMKTVDVLVMSTFYEGLSLSCMEAMASGRPFIASDVPGVHELVNNAGLLFPLENERELANNIISVAQDVALRNKVIAACTQKAQEYDVKVMVQKHMDLYTNLMKTKRS